MTQKRPTNRAARTLSLLVPALCLVAEPALAKLAIFNDGRVVKVTSYRVDGDDVSIELPGGGGFTTSMLLVERFVDDEVAAPAAQRKALPKPTAADLSFKAARKPLFQSRYDGLIESECRKANLDAALVSAVIKAESNYDPRAVSRKGARGLMQLMPSTAARLGVRRSYDPTANIRGGVLYLKELAARFGNQPALILAAYNAGENAVDSCGGVPPYRETVEYVERILKWWSPAAQAPSV
ncbi:MAG: lytic transglycosylase domain-containing protein [Thermoanaerobaculia bacterium]